MPMHTNKFKAHVETKNNYWQTYMWPKTSLLCTYVAVFQEIPFWNIQLTSALYCTCVLSNKILSYLLVSIIANPLYLWWLNFMVFLPSFSNINIAYRGSRWDGRRGWVGEVGGGKNPYLGHPMSSHDIHTVANDTLVSHKVSGSEPRSPTPNWCPPLIPLFQLWHWRIGKNALQKAD